MTDHDHTDLIARLEAAPWHRSGGYDRPDGTRVGRHEYILAKDGNGNPRLIEDMYRLIETKEEPCIWRGRYQGRGHVYRYLTFAQWPEWTFWHMGDLTIINRADDVDRTEREVIPRRRVSRVQPALPDEERL